MAMQIKKDFINIQWCRDVVVQRADSYSAVGCEFAW